MIPADRPSAARAPLLSRQGLLFIAGFILVAIPGVSLFYWAERVRMSNWSTRTEPFDPPTGERSRFYAPGVQTPPTVPSRESTMNDDESVIGIEAGGKARAYRLRAMRGTTRHIINDVIGGSAVSVTYCDLTECVKAFGGGERRTPLDISQAGLMDGHMLLKVGEVSYDQETGEVVEAPKGTPPPPFPYATIPLTRTTWGEWKSRHAETDIYTGPDPVAVRPPPAPDL